MVHMDQGMKNIGVVEHIVCSSTDIIVPVLLGNDDFFASFVAGDFVDTHILGVESYIDVTV